MIIHHNYIHSIRALVLLLTVSAMLGACQKDKPSPNGKIQLSVLDEGYTGQVLNYVNGSFQEQAQTQATENAYKTTFTEGDQIGLYAVKNNTLAVNNLKLTLTKVEGSLQWLITSYGEIPTDADKYFAYYPFKSSFTSGSVNPAGTDAKSFFKTVIEGWKPQNDQSGNKYTSFDLMVGMSTLGNTATNHVYPLNFSLSHQMGLAVIKLPGGVTNLAFNGFTPYADANGAYRFLINPAQPKTLSCSFNNGSDVRGFVISATITGGTYKTYTVSGKPAKMSFKIDLTQYSSSKMYFLPFKSSVKTGNYTLTIDWGDNTASTIIQPFTDLGRNAVKHNYSDATEYTITITTSQSDFTKEQLPDFSPGKLWTSSNNNKKFKAMLTPLLNTGEKDFSSCFAGISFVEPIPEDMFINNPQATNFDYAFKDCNITQIPEKLFANNPEVTSFISTFFNCANLTSIPEALFKFNPKVVEFRNTFASSKITSIPAELFRNNTAVQFFNSCFKNCKSLTTIPDGLFNYNTEVLSFEECFYTQVLTPSALTGEIPAKLFANNLKAKSFKNCFYNQTKLTLNANIFCEENATNKANRFKTGSVILDYCFKSVGSDASLSSAGTAPSLWSYTGISSYVQCFNGVGTTTNPINDLWD